MDPGAGRPRETLWRLFRDSGPGGPGILTFAATPEKDDLAQKIPIFPVVPCRNRDGFDFAWKLKGSFYRGCFFSRKEARVPIGALEGGVWGRVQGGGGGFPVENKGKRGRGW